MPALPLRIALAQVAPTPGDIASNMRLAAMTIATAAARGASLVVFPELFASGYDLPRLTSTPTLWITESDPRFDPVRRACGEHRVTSILGAALRTPTEAQRVVAPVIGPSGDVALSVKEHIHGSEHAVFTAGEAAPPFDVNGWRVAVGICFDAAHPRHAEKAAKAGADLYVGSALYLRGEERRSDLHFGARAMDNRVFAALANYAGETGGYQSCGLSGVWGPNGDAIERVTHASEALVVVDLDPSELARFRSG